MGRGVSAASVHGSSGSLARPASRRRPGRSSIRQVKRSTVQHLEDERVLPPAGRSRTAPGRSGASRPSISTTQPSGPGTRRPGSSADRGAAPAGSAFQPGGDLAARSSRWQSALGGRPRFVPGVEQDGAAVAVARARGRQPERLVQARAAFPSGCAGPGRSGRRPAGRRGRERSGPGRSAGTPALDHELRGHPSGGEARSRAEGLAASASRTRPWTAGSPGQNVSCAAVPPTSTASGAHRASAASRPALAGGPARGVDAGQDRDQLAVPDQPGHGAGPTGMVATGDHPVAAYDGTDLVGELHAPRTPDRCCQTCCPGRPRCRLTGRTGALAARTPGARG